jgi:hypothetical protein
VNTPRINDTQAKRLRARQRAKQLPCHACGGEIDYHADHTDPLSFQLDHLWQVANGGPEYDPDNCASSHRACNRRRSDNIDAIAIAAAATYGVTLTAATKTRRDPSCAPDGHPCMDCDGIHNPAAPGVIFVTTRNWMTDDTHTERRVGYVSSC